MTVILLFLLPLDFSSLCLRHLSQRNTFSVPFIELLCDFDSYLSVT